MSNDAMTIDQHSGMEWMSREKENPHSENDWCDLFSYSSAVKDVGTGFRLGIMTKDQCDLPNKFEPKCICVDATHNTTRYLFKLVIILVPDDRHRPIEVFKEERHEFAKCT